MPQQVSETRFGITLSPQGNFIRLRSIRSNVRTCICVYIMYIHTHIRIFEIYRTYIHVESKREGVRKNQKERVERPDTLPISFSGTLKENAAVARCSEDGIAIFEAPAVQGGRTQGPCWGSALWARGLDMMASNGGPASLPELPTATTLKPLYIATTVGIAGMPIRPYNS